MEIEVRLAVNRSGYWELRRTVPDEKTGRSITRCYSTGTKDRAEAEGHKRDFLRGLTEKATRAGGVLVSTVLDKYEASANARHVGATQKYCLQHLRSYFGAFLAEDMPPDDILNYRAARGVADGTSRRELNTLVAALNWAEKHRIISRAPVIDLPPDSQPKQTVLFEEREKALYAAAVQDAGPDGRLSRVGRFVCIGLDTGARKAAIWGLTWDRVDLKRRTVDFRDPEVRVTKKKRVATKISDRLLPVLERAFAERDAASPLVLDHDGNFRKAWDTFMLRHGFPEVTPHVLRHTCITLLLRAGVPIWDIEALVGTSAAMVQKTYGHHAIDDRLLALANRRHQPQPIAEPHKAA